MKPEFEITLRWWRHPLQLWLEIVYLWKQFPRNETLSDIHPNVTAWTRRITQVALSNAPLLGLARDFRCRRQHDAQNFKQILVNNLGQRKPICVHNVTNYYTYFKESFRRHFRLLKFSHTTTSPFKTEHFPTRLFRHCFQDGHKECAKTL